MDVWTLVIVSVVVLGLVASVAGTVALVRSATWLGSGVVGALGITSIVAYVVLMLGTSALAELDAERKAEKAAAAAAATTA